MPTSTLVVFMNPEAVFKAYDIRGRSDTGELDAELYRSVGGAFVELLGAGEVAVGRDCRVSSQPFFDAFADGITRAGADVIDLGEVPTDAVYVYSGKERVAGAMITASHNPPEYNGLKLCRKGAAPIGWDTGLSALKDAVSNGNSPPHDVIGSIRRVDIVDDYVDHLFSVVDADSVTNLKVAVDGGNGMAGVAVAKVFDRVAASLVGLYIEPDGTFPNHPADPMVPENLADLVTLVSDGGFDLGVAFDGDADRAFFLDDKGSPLSGSAVTSLIARKLISEKPGSSVVHNLITSKAVPEIIRETGGSPIRTRVGHSYIKQIMAESESIFGGEHSGHYYFRDNFGADSGMLAMLVLLSIISDDGRPLSEMRLSVERYASSGEINFVVTDPVAAMSAVEESAVDAAIDHLDGLTVDYGEEWFNLRASNTEPLLRLNVEAANDDRVANLVERISTTLKEIA